MVAKKKPVVVKDVDNGGWMDQLIAQTPAALQNQVRQLCRNYVSVSETSDRRLREKQESESKFYNEQHAHHVTRRGIESAQATMRFLAERLVIAEKAIAQRRDTETFSPGMSDAELGMLVQCVASGGQQIHLRQMTAGPFLLGPAFLDEAPPPTTSDTTKSTGFGRRVLQALEAEFVRRGLVDACDAVQGTIDASQSMLVAEFERGVEAAVMIGHNADSRDVEHALRLVRLKERERLGGAVSEEEWEAAHNDEPYDPEANKEVPNAEVPGSGEAVAGEGEEAPG